jgi:hypothetical protein
MALEGSLKEFGLADILQLIYFQRKTGVLAIEGRTDRVRLGVYEGKIVFAESKRRVYEDRIGKILVKKGVISEENLFKSLEEQKTSGAKLGSIFIKNGFATKEQVKGILTSQITEIVGQLFSWKEGKYEFSPQGVPLDKDVPLMIDTQHLLMEGLRILDELSVGEGKITLESVFEQTGKTDETLTYEERTILDIVDGETDVSTIISVSGMENMQVSKLMLGLLEKGIIAPKLLAQVPVEELPVVKKEIPGLGVLPGAVVSGGLLISIVAMLFFGTFRVDSLKASEGIDGLRFKVDVWGIEHGAYPAALDGFKPSIDPWGKPYFYMQEEKRYMLKSSGPDGREGTADDIY